MAAGEHKLSGGADKRAIVDAVMLGKAPVLVTDEHREEARIDLGLVDRQPPNAVGGGERAKQPAVLVDDDARGRNLCRVEWRRKGGFDVTDEQGAAERYDGDDNG